MTVNCQFPFGHVEDIEQKLIFGRDWVVVYGDGLIFYLSLYLLHSF